ncbi:hypothetical protein [Alicyclobacillus sp. ALC3]|uniref:hypothetical protein n=1 Tax=Alicyclobacillus sp. ALC3 TaxID=2796143 RepID=UPI0023784EF8|nr:hypothetical protein [Alicyclobacillus sp. ALC3]WDL96953.1 hypothetical protein JC200_22185 [Alicyclobacillus sp. ALC3]
MPIDRIRARGVARFVRSDASDAILSDRVHENTVTDWTRAVIAQLLMTPPNGESTAITMSRPSYISLGIGQQSPSRTDSAMFSEVYGTRKKISYTSSFQAFVAQFTVNYLTSDPNGTWYEAGVWDADVSATTLAANASAGATSISVPSTSPVVLGSTAPGQYNTIYIEDGANSEYASIAQTTSAGATTWQLQSGLQYAHASGVIITAFTGNLCNHVNLGPTGESKGIGEQLTVQWSDYIDA